MTAPLLRDVTDLLDAVEGAPGDFQYLASAAGHLDDYRACLLLLADSNGNVISADDLGSGIDPDVAGKLATDLARLLQTESACRLEAATNLGTRTALALRIPDGRQCRILACLIPRVESAAGGLEHLPTPLVVCSAFARTAVRLRADCAKLSRRIEHLQAQQEMLQASHAAAMAAMIAEREQRRHQQRQKAALEEMVQAAETADRAKSQFLANASHELRTPLTAILGYADLLADGSLSHQQRSQHVQTIRRNGHILLEVINDVLDLSKIEAGKLTIERTECSPCRLVEDIVSLMRVQAQENGLGLEIDFRPPIPQVIHTDPVRLRQILMNLIGNAIKFTETGGVRVTIGCARGPDAPARMRFTVADTGRGIAAEAIPRLFSPFSQAEASTNQEFGGTGLGLAISDRLTRMLGGHIEVESRLGEGSTFTVWIDPGPLAGVPMLDAPPEAPDGLQQPSEPGQSPRLCGRVLLAEDAEDSQRLIGLILRSAGMEVDLAENGRIACQRAGASLAEGRPYDLILMDIQMPEMDGYEATRRLRQSGWSRPIVALTAHAMTGDREKCLQAGCDDYLTKPIERTSFLTALGRHL